MNNFKKYLNSNKFKHGTMATVFTAVFIAVVIVLNVVFTALNSRFPSMDIDLTAQGLNTLSETAVETAKKVEMDTKIYIIGAEDDIKADTLYASYGFQYSQVASIAEKMQEANSKITVEYLEPDLNPDFISQYASYALTTGKVLVQTDLRDKVLSVNDFFSYKQNEDGSTNYYSMVDGSMANAVHIVNLDTVPTIAVINGHSEMFDSKSRATFDALMQDNGFNVVEFNSLTDPVPEEAQVVMISTPSTDYTAEEVAKLREFLAKDGANRTLLVTCDPTQADLPVLEEFLEEWGLAIGDGVIAESDMSRAMSTSNNMILVDVNKDILSDGSYPMMVAAGSAPIEILFKANDGVTTYPILTTADSAYTVKQAGDEVEDPETASYNTAALAIRERSVEGGYTSSVIVLGDTYPLFSTFLGSSAFSNREVVVDLMQYTTGVADSSVGIYVEKTETNVQDVTASYATIALFGFYGCTIAVPLIILIIGLVIFLKRRHL